MNEIAPGIWHWTALRESIGMHVQSYYIEPAGLIIDPMVPQDVGLDWWDGREVAAVALTIGLHWRESAGFAERFGVPIRAPEPALKRWSDAGEDDRSAEPFGDGDTIADGVDALEIAGIAPDEYALVISHGSGALAVADGVVRWSENDPLGFVPDELMGDDADEVKDRLRSGFKKALERDWELLLMAHGEPGTRAELLEFLD